MAHAIVVQRISGISDAHEQQCRSSSISTALSVIETSLLSIAFISTPPMQLDMRTASRVGAWIRTMSPLAPCWRCPATTTSKPLQLNDRGTAKPMRAIFALDNLQHFGHSTRTSVVLSMSKTYTAVPAEVVVETTSC